MENAPSIPGVTLEEKREHARVTIRWRGPDDIAALVHIEGQPPECDETRAWPVSPDAARALWDALHRVRKETGAPAGDLALKWSAITKRDQPETPAARELRERLEHAAHLEASQATAALHAGQAFAAAGRRDDAIAMYQFGIAELGARYASTELLDDTESKLILARHALAGGKEDQAATLLERVLESRTLVYAKRFGGH